MVNKEIAVTISKSFNNIMVIENDILFDINNHQVENTVKFINNLSVESAEIN